MNALKHVLKVFGIKIMSVYNVKKIVKTVIIIFVKNVKISLVLRIVNV